MNKSILKWVGGKGRLLPTILPLLPNGGRLIEPFMGSGAIMLNTTYSHYILNDNNQDLINLYRWVKEDVVTLISRVEFYYQQGIENYYNVRNEFNKHIYDIEQAARFVYLNRHGFNGLCRYNKLGEYNVAKGEHKSIYFPHDELLSMALKLNDPKTHIELFCTDYKDIIKLAKKGDVIYCDPPYLSLDNNKTFSGYLKNKFNINETTTMISLLKDAHHLGATIIVSNHNTPFIQELFQGFTIHEINVQRSVASGPIRLKAKEIIAILN